MKKIRKPGLTIVCSLLISLTFSATTARSDAMLRGSLGFSGVSGDVGEYLIKGGVLLGGELYLAVHPMVYLGGGLDVGIHGGQEVSAGGISVGATDAGAVVTFEVGGLLYMIGSESNVRPYVRGTIGRGGLAWNYTDLGELATGEDQDGVGFFLFAPGVGFDVKASDRILLGGEMRGVLTSYDDETTEGFIYDLDGGNFLQVRGFITIWL